MRTPASSAASAGATSDLITSRASSVSVSICAPSSCRMKGFLRARAEIGTPPYRRRYCTATGCLVVHRPGPYCHPWSILTERHAARGRVLPPPLYDVELDSVDQAVIIYRP